MGFSTSGAVIVILIGCLVAFSAIVPSVFDITATTGNAFSTQNDQLREQKNTNIAIESFEIEENTEGIPTGATLIVANNGARTLSVDRTDLVVNGDYYPTDATAKSTTINDDGSARPSSNLWAPRSTLEIDIDSNVLEEGENHVRITTERGIAATDVAATDGGAN